MRVRLHSALSPNGKRVHLATSSGRPVCGSKVIASCRVIARITCPGCAQRRPVAARRRSTWPLVIGLNWEPYYRALGRALDGGATKEPEVKVPYWPVLGDAS